MFFMDNLYEISFTKIIFFFFFWLYIYIICFSCIKLARFHEIKCEYRLLQLDLLY